MCARESYKAGLFGHFRLIGTCVCVFQIRQVWLVISDKCEMCTCDSYRVGLFGHFRLIRT